MNTILPLALIAFVTLPAWPQSEHPISGRRIAGVMSVAGAEWLDRGEREKEELPETALDAIGIREGMQIADIGAGSGYFTSRLSRRVGPSGKVYAVEVQPEMMAILRRRVAREKLTNVETVPGTEADPRLQPNSVDLILLVDVYHEFSQPQAMLRHMKKALRQNGRLVLLEYRKEDPHIPIRSEHKMSVAEARLELEAEGYKLDKVLDDLPRQHILIFRKDIM